MRDVLVEEVQEPQTRAFSRKPFLSRVQRPSSEGTVRKDSLSFVDFKTIFRDYILKSILPYELPGLYLMLHCRGSLPAYAIPSRLPWVGVLVNTAMPSERSLTHAP